MFAGRVAYHARDRLNFSGAFATGHTGVIKRFLVSVSTSLLLTIEQDVSFTIV